MILAEFTGWLVILLRTLGGGVGGSGLGGGVPVTYFIKF